MTEVIMTEVVVAQPNGITKHISITSPSGDSMEMDQVATAIDVVKNTKTERLTATVTKPTPYTFDLGNLLCLDPNPLPHPISEDALSSTARDAAQALINQLLTTCPISSTLEGVLLSLPALSTPLPREKPIPAEKPKTKWELFAEKKGIQSKEKKGKLVYDEAKGEWVPRWGYKGKNKENDNQWLVEVDEKKERETGQADDGRKAGRVERKERIKRQERRERANEKRGVKKA